MGYSGPSKRGLNALFVLIMVTATISGCLAANDSGAPGDGAQDPGEYAFNWTAPQNLSGAAFTPTQILDDMRAGGEPVIAVTEEGTIIVSAHPGYTHFHPQPVSPELLVPSQSQVYLWRSTDGGESWEHVSLLPADSPNSGPRGLGQGVSDPDLSYDHTTGRIWLTDLEALAASSVSWSDDDGETWLMGNNIASGGPIDRQWLASHNGTAFFTGNYFPTSVWPPGSGGTTTDFIASEDGIVWEGRGMTPCNGDPVVNPTTGTIYQACGNGFTFSTDGGYDWEHVEGPVGCGLCEIGIDAAGTVYMSGVTENGTVSVAYTMDDGESWSDTLEITQYFPDLAEADDVVSIWPWTSAGSEGRLAVTFLAATGVDSRTDPDGKWHAYTATIINATGGAPEIWPTRLTETPLHEGAVCVGTVCQASTTTSASGDRRLGDFFETTIDHEGRLHVAYTNTAEQPDHTVGHVAYHKQTEGPSLVVGEVPAGFPTQG